MNSTPPHFTSQVIKGTPEKPAASVFEHFLRKKRNGVVRATRSPVCSDGTCSSVVLRPSTFGRTFGTAPPPARCDVEAVRDERRRRTHFTLRPRLSNATTPKKELERAWRVGRMERQRRATWTSRSFNAALGEEPKNSAHDARRHDSFYDASSDDRKLKPWNPHRRRPDCAAGLGRSHPKTRP